MSRLEQLKELEPCVNQTPLWTLWCHLFALFLCMKMFVGLCLNYRTTDGYYSLRFRAILIFSEQKLQLSRPFIYIYLKKKIIHWHDIDICFQMITQFENFETLLKLLSSHLYNNIIKVNQHVICKDFVEVRQVLVPLVQGPVCDNQLVFSFWWLQLTFL